MDDEEYRRELNERCAKPPEKVYGFGVGHFSDIQLTFIMEDIQKEPVPMSIIAARRYIKAAARIVFHDRTSWRPIEIMLMREIGGAPGMPGRCPYVDHGWIKDFYIRCLFKLNSENHFRYTMDDVSDLERGISW
jgi:hypothetical protein